MISYLGVQAMRLWSKGPGRGTNTCKFYRCDGRTNTLKDVLTMFEAAGNHALLRAGGSGTKGSG